MRFLNIDLIYFKNSSEKFKNLKINLNSCCLNKKLFTLLLAACCITLVLANYNYTNILRNNFSVPTVPENHTSYGTNKRKFSETDKELLTAIIDVALHNKQIPDELLTMGQYGNSFLNNSYCASFPTLFDIQFTNTYWQSHRSSNWSIYLFGSYWDGRTTKGEPFIRILGVVDGDIGNSTLYCQVWFRHKDPFISQMTALETTGEISTTPVNSTNMLFVPHLWKCPLLSEESEVPVSVSIVEYPCENASNNVKIHFENAKINLAAICVEGVNPYNTSIVSKLVERLEAVKMFEGSKLFLYELILHQNLSNKLLDPYVNSGFVETVQLNFPDGRNSILSHEYSSWMTEFIPGNDCLYRNLYSYEYVVSLGIDEIFGGDCNARLSSSDGKYLQNQVNLNLFERNSSIDCLGECDPLDTRTDRFKMLTDALCGTAVDYLNIVNKNIDNNNQFVILNVGGGIGNQLFQYAAAYSLSKKIGCELYICVPQNWESSLLVESLQNFNQGDRSYSLNFFNIPHNKIIISGDGGCDYSQLSNKTSNGDIVYISEEQLITEKFSLDKSLYFTAGYMESEILFKEYKQDILEMLSFNKSFQVHEIFHKTIEGISTSMGETESVAVHVRRGDFANPNDYRILPMSYYIQAIQMMKEKIAETNGAIENIKFYVFSDDIESVKGDFAQMDNTTQFEFISNQNLSRVFDFFLMSMCKHNIVANSTFSWWAAYLNRNKNKIVVAPMPKFKTEWFQDLSKNNRFLYQIYGGVWTYPYDWITINPHE